MELLSWIPILMAAALICATFLVSPHSHPHSGRHYSRTDRRRYSR